VATVEVVLGIDIGTSSTKGLLVTPEGQVIESAQRAHQISLPRPGWAEADAENTWWDEVCSICKILTSSAPGPIIGVCVDGVGPSLVLCDADLAPLRPAILYGIDTRGDRGDQPAEPPLWR
jgi:xylulokinase